MRDGLSEFFADADINLAIPESVETLLDVPVDGVEVAVAGDVAEADEVAEVADAAEGVDVADEVNTDDVDDAVNVSDSVEPSEPSESVQSDVSEHVPAARQLDASDFIIDSMDVVEDEPESTVETAANSFSTVAETERHPELDADTNADAATDVIVLGDESKPDQSTAVESLSDQIDRDSMDMTEAGYTSSLEEFLEEETQAETKAEAEVDVEAGEIVDVDAVVEVNIQSDVDAKDDVEVSTRADTDAGDETQIQSDSAALDNETHQPDVNVDDTSGEIQGDGFVASDTLNDEVDIDLVGESIESPDLDIDMSVADDSTVGEIYEIDVESAASEQVSDVEPITNTASVVYRGAAEIVEHPTTIDSLDSTQSGLDIPYPTNPGGFFRRWYIRGAAYLKRVWRRIRRTKSSD